MNNSAPFDRQRWAQIDAVLDLLLDCPQADRAQLLDRHCAGDPALREEVESLLAASAASERFLTGPALPTGTAASVLAAAPSAFGSERIGCYRLVQRIGRGGMGEVYEAERADGQFEQRVAIKLIRADIEVPVARFEAERQILARLDHPGIARLIDGGIADDGRPYMVVEFVPGTTLRTYCTGRDLDLGARLALFRQIAEAVRYAHRHLVIHRDLKPANVMVDGDGRARLLDFGIATLLDEPGLASAPTRMLVTPESAAPEQLRGEPISTATDVYALGLLLHELLTGFPPRDFSGLPLTVAIRQVLEASLPPPSTRSRVLPPAQLRGDLDAIVARALRPDLQSRYASVDALLDDLDRWQRCEPVLARDGTRAYVINRFLSRHRLAVSAAAAVIVVVLIGVLGVLWQAREAARQRDVAQSEAARANAVRDYVLYMFRSASEARHDGAEVSAREALAQAAAQVRVRFADDPGAARAMLLSLGDLFFEMRDGPGAEAVLREYLAMPAGDSTEAALVRARLADLRYDAGDYHDARTLLDGALPALATAIDRHFDRSVDARLLDATLVRADGDTARAIERISAIAEDVEARRGSSAGKLAETYNELGNALIADQRPMPAADAYRRALDIYTRNARGDSLDALVVQGNLCDALLRGQQHDTARDCFRRLLPRHESLYGESLALVSLLLEGGLAELGEGDGAAALALIDRAAGMGARFVRRDTALSRIIDLSRAEALYRLGRRQEVGDIVATERGNADPLVAGIAMAIDGQLLLDAGRQDAARAALDQAAAAIGKPHPYRWHGERVLAALRARLGA